MTQTQYVARINELQQELAAEERRTAKLSQAMDDMINEVENRGPVLVELRDEQERLEAGSAQLLPHAGRRQCQTVIMLSRMRSDGRAKLTLVLVKATFCGSSCATCLLKSRFCW